MADKPFEPPTAKMMDEETKTKEEHQNKMGAIALEIEQIFLRENLTMGDLSEVLDLFNSRAQAVFSGMSIKSIKENYERHH